MKNDRVDEHRPARLSRQGTLALLLVIVAGAIFLQTIALVDRSPETSAFYDLAPYPDGVQYFAAAVSLIDGGNGLIQINGELQPPLYPFGYSLLVAATIPFATEPVTAVYLVNVVASALILVLGGLVTWRLYGLLAASLVVLLIATLPAFVILGNSPMSGTTASLVVMASVSCWLLYALEGKSGWGILAAFLLGVGLWFKTASVFFVPLLFFGTLSPTGMKPPQRVRALVVHGGVSMIGVTPVLVYNWLRFGDPLRTGYHFWLGQGSGLAANLGPSAPRFEFTNIGSRLLDLAREALELPMAFSTLNLYGYGSAIGAGGCPTDC